MKKQGKTGNLLAGADSAAFPSYIDSIGMKLLSRYDFHKEHLSGKTGQTFQIRWRGERGIYCLKTVKESVADRDRERVRETLKKEVEILKPLNHRCLPRVYEEDTNAPLPYYVCTFHPGQTWAQFRSSGEMIELSEATFVVTSLIDALEYLHGEGRTHCDLHEENILIGPRILADGIMIIDYGSGHRESAEAPTTDDRGHLGHKDIFDIPGFRYSVDRQLHNQVFQENDFRALGRLLALMKNVFFGKANTEQRLAYMDFAANLHYGKLNNWRVVRERFEQVIDPNLLLTRTERLLLGGDGNRSYIPMPATGRISVGEPILDIINTKCFQRLRGIKQLSFCEWFFPGGTHTRFEHSIGVYGAAYSALQHLIRDPVFKVNHNQRNVDGLLLAALLHDVGHYPFAHVIEHYVAARYPEDKELKSDIHHFEHSLHLIKNDNDLKSAIENHWGEDGNDEVHKNLQGGSGLLSDILDGPIDCDKIDYLRRDAHHCGVPYGNGLNVEQIFNSFRCSPTTGRLVIHEDGVAPVEGMVLAQDQMLASVYWHETTRALFAMFHRFLDIVVGRDLSILRNIVGQLKNCSSEYDAMQRILLPRADALKKHRVDALRLVNLHKDYNFKEIYIPIKRYAWVDATHATQRSVENIYSRIVKQNLSSIAYGNGNSMPIDWDQVRRLRGAYINALQQKNIEVSSNDVLIDVPWGKPSNRMVKVLRGDERTEVQITDVSHLAESIFTLPTAHIAPVRVYLRPEIHNRAAPFIPSIILSAEEMFDGRGKIDFDE
ncbi:MAG: HD domain-containing protein [Nitrosomonadales bacterium]|nr:HD domain-containing protein [Nitrosomonadales bacterium]